MMIRQMVVFGGTKMTERKIILYISQSLDGFIADNNKSVDCGRKSRK